MTRGRHDPCVVPRGIVLMCYIFTYFSWFIVIISTLELYRVICP